MKMSFRNKQLYQLSKAQFLETVREPGILFWGMVFPILISVGLGLAFTQTKEYKFNIAIVNTVPQTLDSLLTQYAQPKENKGEITRHWAVPDKILGNTVFIFHFMTWDDAIIALKRNEVDILITDSAAQCHYHFDPHNSQAQLAYLKLTTLLKSPPSNFSEQGKIEALTLKGVRYIDFLIPGVIALGIINSLCWGVSYAIVERRSQKLLRRMVATPMKKSNFLISMVLVRIAMNFVQIGLFFSVAWLIFGTTIQGSLWALLILFLSANIAFAGIAILLASRTSKVEVGNGLINAITMPMMILSGIFFSYHNFPDWSIGFIKALPLTAIADGLRAIFNEGAGFPGIMLPSFFLFALGVVCFSIGVKVFKWY